MANAILLGKLIQGKPVFVRKGIVARLSRFGLILFRGGIVHQRLLDLAYEHIALDAWKSIYVVDPKERTIIVIMK